MRTLILSDAHLTGPADPAQPALIAFLDAVEAADTARVVFGGDIFHAWWGRPRVQARYQDVVAAIRRLRDRGVAVVWIPGNHDFAVGPVLGALVAETTAWTGEVAGRRWRVVHGDEADATWGYRLTRRALRGRAFAAAMRAVGPARGDALLDRLAGRSRDHMAPAARVVEAQRQWARARLGEGAQAVALGHSHALGLVQDQRGVIVHLGDWGAQRSWLELSPAGAHLHAGWGHAPRVVGHVPPAVGVPAAPQPAALQGTPAGAEPR